MQTFKSQIIITDLQIWEQTVGKLKYKDKLFNNETPLLYQDLQLINKISHLSIYNKINIGCLNTIGKRPSAYKKLTFISLSIPPERIWSLVSLKDTAVTCKWYQQQIRSEGIFLFW